MKESNKQTFQLFKDYRWMRELIEEKEAMSALHSDDSFLSMLNQDVDRELEDLKEKVKYVDRTLEHIKDDQSYWMLNLLRQGYTASRVIEMMRISPSTLYRKCDEALTLALATA